MEEGLAGHPAGPSGPSAAEHTEEAPAAAAAAGGAEQPEDIEGLNGVPLSKSQQKKRAKHEARMAKKAERKEREKQERAALRSARKEEAAKRVAAMTADEKLAFKEECRKKREERQAQDKDKRARLAAAVKEGQRIIIDLDFAELMTDQELRSMAQQLGFAYSANVRAAVPAHLHLTSLAGRMGELLRRQLSGLDNWLVTRSEAPYQDLFAGRTDELVYLTADSPNELEALDPGKAYIIGGIVDRNRHKDLCAGKARQQGIATARLPVLQHFRLTSYTVLTTNQVVEALLNYLELRDWRAALERTIPTRKRGCVAEKPSAAAAPDPGPADPTPAGASSPPDERGGEGAGAAAAGPASVANGLGATARGAGGANAAAEAAVGGAGVGNGGPAAGAADGATAEAVGEGPERLEEEPAQKKPRHDLATVEVD